MTSVIVPCYGQYVQYLESCLSNLMLQTAKPEIIVVGNKEAEKICMNFKVHYLQNESSKQSNMINLGIKNAKGKYILDMGVDDVLIPKYIATAQKFLNKNPTYDVFVPQYEVFGNTQGVWKASGLIPEILENNTMFMGSIFRKSLWEHLGGIDENIPHDTLYDWEFWIRVYKSGSKAYLSPDILYHYRVSSESTAVSWSQFGQEFLAYAKQKGTL